MGPLVTHPVGAAAMLHTYIHTHIHTHMHTHIHTPALFHMMHPSMPLTLAHLPLCNSFAHSFIHRAEGHTGVFMKVCRVCLCVCVMSVLCICFLRHFF